MGENKKTARDFGLIDDNRKARRELALWLDENFPKLCREASCKLPNAISYLPGSHLEEGELICGQCSLTRGLARRAAETEFGKLVKTLSKKATRRQITLAIEIGKKHGFEITREIVKKTLWLSLTHQIQPKFDNLRNASQWCNCPGVEDYINSKSPQKLAGELYPLRPYNTVVIERGPTEEIIDNDRLPLRQAPLAFLEVVEGLQSALMPNGLYRHLKPESREKLAAFVLTLVMELLEVDAEGQKKYFRHKQCLKLVRRHFGSGKMHFTIYTRALIRVFRAVEADEGLRSSLLVLAGDALTVENQRRKGRPYLRKRLEAVFDHICQLPSDREQFGHFIRLNFPYFRNTTPQRREKMFGEFQDDKIRDLTPKEILKQYEKFLNRQAEKHLKPKTLITFDEGRSASEATLRNARDDVLAEMGFKRGEPAPFRRKKAGQSAPV
jgi:hypothetical protein